MLVVVDALLGGVEGGDGAGEEGDAGGDGVARLERLIGGGLVERSGGRGGIVGDVGEGGGAENGALFEAVNDTVFAVFVFLGVFVGLGGGEGEVAGADGGVALGSLRSVGLATGEAEGGGAEAGENETTDEEEHGCEKSDWKGKA